jgi:hypothetical protein
LTGLRTPEGTPLPANTLAEMRRDLARLRFVKEQIKEIERARGWCPRWWCRTTVGAVGGLSPT